MHERARLEQLGRVDITPGDAKTGSGGFFAEIQRIRKIHGWGVSEHEAVADLYQRLSSEPFLCEPKHDPVACWWDPRIQDWGTSPNAPDGWPAPAKDPEDIRARLDVVLKGYEMRARTDKTGLWHQTAENADEYWTAAGTTEDAAYLAIWHEMEKFRS